MHRLTTFLWLLFFIIIPLPAGSENILTIYYTSSLNGNLDGCRCEMNPVAGLVKRAAFLHSLETSGPSLILDAGDIFDEYPDPDLAAHILQVYEELGYDAIAVGDQEFTIGAAGLLEYKMDFPLICHNLRVSRGESGGEPFTPGPVIVETGGLRIGILALIDPTVVIRATATQKEGIRVSTPVSTAEAMLGLYRQGALDLTVLLYHGSFRGALEAVKACPEIDIAIFAHEGLLFPPQKVGSTILASPGEEGNRLGILTLHLGSGGIESFENKFRFFSYEEDPDDPKVRRRIETYRQELRSRLFH